MTKSINSNDDSQSSPPSGGNSSLIDTDAVRELSEGEGLGLVTESELKALAEIRGQKPSPAAYVPRLLSGEPIDTTNARFDRDNPLNWPSGDGYAGTER
jgi:hypothetical protein